MCNGDIGQGLCRAQIEKWKMGNKGRAGMRLSVDPTSVADVTKRR